MGLVINKLLSTTSETNKCRSADNKDVLEMTEKVRKLQGRVTRLEKTGQSITDEEGTKWEKCIFTVELTNFSKRTPNEVVPEDINGKKVKIFRYCCFDWHYKLGVRKTLESDETEAVLAGKPTKTVYW